MTNIASSGVSGTYAAINSTGLPFACEQIFINNASTKDVTVSLDGTNDHFYVVSATLLAIQNQANALPDSRSAMFSKGTVFWVKGTGGTGNIYLSGLYQPIES